MGDITLAYCSLFVLSDEEPTGHTDIMPFCIETKDASLVKLCPYQIPVCYQKEVQQQLSRMEDQGIITLSKSAWSSPLVAVKKKDGTAVVCRLPSVELIVGGGFLSPSFN